MRFGKLRHVDSVANRAMQKMCEDAAALFADGTNFGGRVWLLPRWYIHALAKPAYLRLAYTEVAIRLAQRPRMVLAARVFGPVPNDSGIPWVVGKGLVGRLTLLNLDYDVLDHSSFWPADLATMTEQQWRNVDEDIRAGRSLAEAQKLKSMYGTAVGVPLRDAATLAKLGCVTLHTASGRSLTSDEIEKLVRLMVTQSPELSRQIVRRASLRIASDTP